MDPSIRLIFNLLHNRYAIDFSYYKSEMIVRRVERRVKLSQVDGFDDYIRLLEEDVAEVDHLYHDMLIGVTDFFRDPRVYERLQLDVLPQLLDELAPDEEFRCWIAGTATGEEAYSIAMLIAEQLDKRNDRRRVRIFASDVHESSLQRAGRGVYVEEQMHGVTPERRRKFFIERQDGYYISPDPSQNGGLHPAQRHPRRPLHSAGPRLLPKRFDLFHAPNPATVSSPCCISGSNRRRFVPRQQ